MIQPIVVRPIVKAAADAPGYEIVAGERRWQAAKLAGLTEIPVVIRENALTLRPTPFLRVKQSLGHSARLDRLIVGGPGSVVGPSNV